MIPSVVHATEPDFFYACVRRDTYIYAEESPNSEKIATLEEGDVCRVLGEEGCFYRVFSGGFTGYVEQFALTDDHELLGEIRSHDGVAADEDTYVYSSPSRSSQIIAERRKGATETITGDRDNFLAYVYHDGAQQKIEEAISAVYSDFWMYFPVPSAVFDLDPETTGVKEYLSEDDADIKITLLAYDQEANDKKLDALVESFKKNGIAVECTVVFTSREQGGAAASEDALQTYMSKTGWYDDIAEFSIRSNGQLEYRKWRK